MEYLMGASIAIGVINTVLGTKSQNKQNRIAADALNLQASEIQRQRKLETERQRRENLELMNSVSNLTNVAWSGANAPTMTYDKYGDLG